MKPYRLPLVLFVVFFLIGSAQAQRLIVGTYTHSGVSKGIYIYDFDSKTGRATRLSVAEAGNPSYLAVSQDSRFVYSVNESDSGKIYSFSYDRSNGTLHLLNQQPNNGSAPCYVSLDQTGRWLFAGNYGSGNLTVHPIQADGAIGALQQRIQHRGSSVNQNRQTAPHVHCTYISKDNQRLYVPDLGIDQVVVYPFEARSGKLDSLNSIAIPVPAGGGPRHIVFSSDSRFAYLIEELTGNVLVIRRSGSQYEIIQTENHLPANQQAAGADIHLSPDGRFLYTSQRSNSAIEIFKVHQKNGTLTYLGQQATGGQFPRNFTIHPSGNYLLAANQKSDDITIFRRNPQTGLLTSTGTSISVGAPVCLQWID